MLTVINWNGGGDGVNWTDASNSAGGLVPGVGDTAVIDLPGSDPTIVYNTTSTVDSLQTKDNTNVTGGVGMVTDTASVPSGAVATISSGRVDASPGYSKRKVV